MSEHTPGPWNVRPISYPERAHPEVYAGEKRIARPCNSADVPAPESDANARLIAAAPELLVALERIERVFTDAIDQEGFYDRAVIMDELDEYRATWIAAIAKARG